VKSQENIEAVVACLSQNQNFTENFAGLLTAETVAKVGKSLRVIKYRPGQVVHFSGDEAVGVMVVLKGRVLSFMTPTDIETMRSSMNLNNFLRMARQDLRVGTSLIMLEQYGIDSIKKKFVSNKVKQRNQLALTHPQEVLQIAQRALHSNSDKLLTFKPLEVPDVMHYSQNISDYVEHNRKVGKQRKSSFTGTIVAKGLNLKELVASSLNEAVRTVAVVG
jgi:CRP-like cAMP-binding protein